MRASGCRRASARPRTKEVKEMRRLLLTALIGLLLLASEASASGGVPGNIGFGVQFNFKWGHNSPSGVLGPWYQYWPYEAHFITPAHPHYPFWPSPQTLQRGVPHAQPPTPVPSYWK
jgi:hypothetical protein